MFYELLFSKRMQYFCCRQLFYICCSIFATYWYIPPCWLHHLRSFCCISFSIFEVQLRNATKLWLWWVRNYHRLNVQYLHYFEEFQVCCTLFSQPMKMSLLGQFSIIQRVSFIFYFDNRSQNCYFSTNFRKIDFSQKIWKCPY